MWRLAARFDRFTWLFDAITSLAADHRALGQSRGREAADDSAAQSLAAQCEAVTHQFAEPRVDFLTDEMPHPRTASILGCFLCLATADTGTCFWWQCTAGIEDTALPALGQGGDGVRDLGAGMALSSLPPVPPCHPWASTSST